jgi:HCOMODA/2-hydroxy-3-carboxy-muconic semialdehyde decarboxylase
MSGILPHQTECSSPTMAACYHCGERIAIVQLTNNQGDTGMTRRARFGAVAIVAVAFAAGIEQRTARAQTPPISAGPVDPALIEDLVVANRVLALEGLFDAYGHVSVRHPGNPNRYLMSRSLAPALVTANDIMEYDLDSNPIDPKGRRSVLERFIHGEIYRVRPDVKAVIHSHSPTVVPFSVTQVPLRPVMHNATFLWVGVPVWEIRDAGGPGTDMLVRNAALGKSLAATLGDKPVALMRGHGNVVVGPDIQMAVRYAYYTEVNARLQATAIGLGGPITYISAEEGAARDKNPGDFARAWELWKKQALGK